MNCKTLKAQAGTTERFSQWKEQENEKESRILKMVREYRESQNSAKAK
jgi:hypothetical protein